MAAPLMGVTRKDTKFIWDDGCEQAFLAHKKCLVQLPVLMYSTGNGPFVLSMNTNNTGMGGVLEQEQEEMVEWSRGLLPMCPKCITQAKGTTALPIKSCSQW